MTSADDIRNALLTVLTDYNAAVVYDESLWPFTVSDKPVIYCRQFGGASTIGEFSNPTVDVWLFTKANAERQDLPQLFTDGETAWRFLTDANQSDALRTLLRDTLQSCIFAVNGVSGMTSENMTGQNRYFVKFTVETLRG